MSLVQMIIPKHYKSERTPIATYNEIKLDDVIREHIRQYGDECIDANRSIDAKQLVYTALKLYHMTGGGGCELNIYYYLWDQAKDAGLSVWEGQFGRIKVPENIK